MKTKQLELLLAHNSTHRYQVLDALSDAEDARLDLPPQAFSPRTPLELIHSQSQDGYSHHYGLPSGNPYSHIKGEVNIADSNLAGMPHPKISARTFEREVTRILRQYSPTVGKRRKLRPEFQSFVASNISKTPMGRYRILSELKKYDLSISGFAEPLFNREISDHILNKLRRIGEL